MSSVSSPVDKIENLWIEPWPQGRVFQPLKVVRHDNVTIMILKSGYRLYATGVQSHIHYGDGGTGFSTGLMKCLLKLKIITKQQMDEHLNWIKVRQEKSEMKWALELLVKYAEKYRFEIMDDQRMALGGCICDACGNPIWGEEDNAGVECNMHKKCVKNQKKGVAKHRSTTTAPRTADRP